jgi:hypothetical protein
MKAVIEEIWNCERLRRSGGHKKIMGTNDPKKGLILLPP